MPFPKIKNSNSGPTKRFPNFLVFSKVFFKYYYYLLPHLDKLEIKLTDYNVEIFTGGVEATVKVVMSAMDKNGQTIIAQATSPDVIVASVSAFEKCYNFLYYKHKK